MSKLIGIFLAVLLAEMGDKTQFATMLFATDRNLSPFTVFLAAGGALVLSSAIAVLVGSVASSYLEQVPFNLIAGVLFIGMGALSILEHYGIGKEALLAWLR